MSVLVDLENASDMMNTPAEIVEEAAWWELRTVAGKKMLGRSTSHESMERLQKDLREKGYTEMESNV